MELNRKATDTYSAALRVGSESDEDRSRVLLSLALAAGDSGQVSQALAAVDEALLAAPQTNLKSILEFHNTRIVAQEAQGDFRSLAKEIRTAIYLFERQPTAMHDESFVHLMRSRLTATFNTSSDTSAIKEASHSLLTVLNHARKPNVELWTAWVALGRAYSLLGEFDKAISSHRYIFQITQETHGYGLARVHSSELFAESLLRQSRLREAKSANATSLRSAKELLRLEPLSLRSRYQFAQVEVREGEILQSLGQIQESAAALQAAIEILEPMARESSVIFVKSTLTRAYMLADRIEEARPLVTTLLEQGWRRPDWIRLAAEKGVLPNPIPPPLDLDLSLPPKIRAHIDTLSDEPPPWQRATDLPTIEEILAAEEARFEIETRSPG